MAAKDTLFHINWGDGDNCYCIAPNKATAVRRMPDGKGMVNYVVKLDHLYQLIFKAGIKEVVEWIEKQGKYEDVIIYPIEIYGADWQAKLKDWGIDAKSL